MASGEALLEDFRLEALLLVALRVLVLISGALFSVSQLHCRGATLVFIRWCRIHVSAARDSP